MKKCFPLVSLLTGLLMMVMAACNDSAPAPDRNDVDHTDNNDTMNRVIDSLRTHHVNDSGQQVDTR
jgi:hypothetical protein